MSMSLPFVSPSEKRTVSRDEACRIRIDREAGADHMPSAGSASLPAPRTAPSPGAQRNAVARAEQLAYLPKGEYLKLAVLGYRQVVADLIWLQAVQHIGAKRDTSLGIPGPIMPWMS